MRIIIICVALLTISCSGYTQPYEHQFLVKVGDTAPDFVINEISGKSYKLRDLRGSVVMLQFTASWCSVCNKEMPYIENEIWQVGKNKGLKVIGIDLDEPIDKVKEFAKRTKVTYPLALDPEGAIFYQYAQKPAGVTRNVIVDREGKIIALTRLFNKDEFDSMKKIIFEELDKK
ncbi:MAG: TlpA family protein disulfide reductase [Salinivirgaceae bacterium]|jgi:peroxiredoxin|nr:redoxin domain-containing protein [Bacteroidales bacterium]